MADREQNTAADLKKKAIAFARGAEPKTEKAEKAEPEPVKATASKK